MSFAQKLKNRMQEMNMSLAASIADDSLSEQRLAICKECPFYISLTSQCKKCGCFMKAKTKITAAKCPIGKW